MSAELEERLAAVRAQLASARTALRTEWAAASELAELEPRLAALRVEADQLFSEERDVEERLRPLRAGFSPAASGSQVAR